MTEPALTYRELDAPASLAAHVKCLWHLEGDGAGATPEPIVPDGCAEIVLNFADPFVRHADDGAHRQPLALCAGALSRAVFLQPSGRIDIWGIRFHPWSAARFVGASAVELRDQLPGLAELSPPLLAAFEEVRDAPSQRRHDAIARVLERRARRVPAVDAMLPASIRHIMSARQPTTVRALAKHFGSSVRRMQAMFERDVGLPPKLLTRIARFQRALAVARSNPDISWGAVAQAANYYDHSHLVHDSHDLVGCPPSALAARSPGLTEVFLDDGAQR